MTIGIDASRAFLKKRTGIEEYAYQTIKHLRTTIPETEEVVLYLRKKLQIASGRILFVIPEIDFELPKNWRVRGIWAPRFWTQIALSLEMLFYKPNVLFVPAHTVPLIHPKKTIVTVHGLEYEICKEAYSFWERLYMHHSIKFSCKVASTVICVSQNTKKDVMNIYGAPEEKIRVIYEGYVNEQSEGEGVSLLSDPYFLFIGRLEERKNILRIVEAFEILKEKENIPHKLVLIGKFGYGKEKILLKVEASKYKADIVLPGYVTEEEKWQWLDNADIFLFPTLYEGFGIPILEAQNLGVPVVTSNVSSLPEVAGEGAVLVDPLSPESIAEGVQKLLRDEAFRSDIIRKATQNVARFSWKNCALEISKLLKK